MTKNPYTVIADQTRKHGRFNEVNRTLFCSTESCEFATDLKQRSARIRSHAHHVAHHVKEALIAEGMLPKEEEVAAA